MGDFQKHLRELGAFENPDTKYGLLVPKVRLLKTNNPPLSSQLGHVSLFQILFLSFCGIRNVFRSPLHFSLKIYR